MGALVAVDLGRRRAPTKVGSYQSAVSLIALVLLWPGSRVERPSACDMRKLLLAHTQTFPAPVHAGSASIWHLADILSWLQARGSHKVSGELLELAAAALKVNVAKEQERLQRHPG